MNIFESTGEMINTYAKRRHASNLVTGGCFTQDPQALINLYQEKGLDLEVRQVEGDPGFYRYSSIKVEISILEKRLAFDHRKNLYFIQGIDHTPYAKP